MMFADFCLVLLTIAIHVGCEGKPTSKCGDNEFPCNDGTCVEKSKWCDTREECLDGSDELYCYPRTVHRSNPNRCDESLFLCKDGRCIPTVGRCDGYPSCPDFSDEDDCGTTAETTVPYAPTTTTEIEAPKIQLLGETAGVTQLELGLEHDNLHATSSQSARKSLKSLGHHLNSQDSGIKSDVNVFQSGNGNNYSSKHAMPTYNFVKAGTDASQDANKSMEALEPLDPYDVVVKEDMNLFLNDSERKYSLEYQNPQEHAPQNTNESKGELENPKDYINVIKEVNNASENVTEKKDSFQSSNGMEDMEVLNINESSDASEHLEPHGHFVIADPRTFHYFSRFNHTKKQPKPQDSFVNVEILVPENKIQDDDSRAHSHYNSLKWHKKFKFPTDLDQRFSALNPNDFRLQRTNAQKWLLKVREENYGWGDETARAMTALYMSSDDLMAIKPSEKLLMSNQLHLKLITALMRNETKRISLGELALFINALSASCDNARNFYGHDLVNILRQRTNVADESGLAVVPLVYLVLCINNATSTTDVERLQKYETQIIDIVGIKATAALAMTCIHRSVKLKGSQQGLPDKLLDKIRNGGLSENIYDLALMAQALNEAGIDQDLWNRSEIMNRLITSQKPDGSFGDILSTYYVMPLLSGNSLLSLNQHCHLKEDEGLIPVDVLKYSNAEKWEITYILRFGNPPDLSQILQLTVKKLTNFFDIMRISATINPAYKFRYVMSCGVPSVYSIGGVVNDAEKAQYWSLHVGSRFQQNTTREVLKPFEGDIRNFIPSEDQYLVFWMKPVL